MMIFHCRWASIFCSICFNILLTDCFRLANQVRIRSSCLFVQYSPTELSNLKIVTDKKLGPKLGLDYLLITTTVKPSQSRSEILDCIAQSELASNENRKQLKVKIVKEQERFDRELKNYKVMYRCLLSSGTIPKMRK